MSFALCGVQPLPPTIASGRSAAASSSRRRARSPAAGGCGDARHGHGVGDVGHGRQDVLGQCEHDRAGPTRDGRRECARDELGDALRPVDLAHPLGHAAEHLLVVDLLEGLAAAVAARHLTDQQHERRGVLHRRVHARRGVRRAGPAGDHAHARAAGQLAVGVGGVGGSRLVPARDHAQPLAVAVEAVEQGQVALAGHAERELDVVQRELVGEQLPAAPS